MNIPRPATRTLARAVLCAIFLVITGPAHATECVDYRAPYLRSIARIDAPSAGIQPVVAGDLLIVPRSGVGFSIYSLANPDLPGFLGSMSLPGLQEIACLGQLAVAADGASGVAVINIADPAAPVVLGSVDTPGGAAQVAAGGRYAYVADRGSGVQIVSLVDPAHPSIVASIPAPGTHGDVWDVALSGNTLLLACGDAGLLSVSVASPHTPVVLDTLASAYWCTTVATEGDLACLSRSDLGLSVVDISNPRELRLDGTCAARGYTDYAAISGTHGMLFDYYSVGTAPGPGVLYTFDISDPSHPRVSGRLHDFWSGSGIAISGSRGYVTDWEGGITVIDARNLDSPPGILLYGDYGWVSSAGSDASFTYLVGENDSWCGLVTPWLAVMDLSDPSAPRFIGGTQLWNCDGGVLPEVVCFGGYAYVADDDFLDVVSVQDPARTLEASYMPLGGSASGIAVRGSYLYVACGTAGLKIVDVSTPSAPAVVSTFHQGIDVHAVTIAGHLAYLGEGARLEIADLANPLAPASLGWVNTPGEVGGVAPLGSLAFVADGAAGLAVVDVTDPGAPVLLSTVDTPGSAVRVAVDEGIAYVGDAEWGVQVIDVHDARAPVLLGRIPILGSASLVSLDADNLYVVGGDDGFQIRPKQCVLATHVAPAAASDPARPLTISPNPTSSGARISLALDTPGLHATTPVRLTIYGITGRRVREIAGTGGAEFAWDGRDDHGGELPSGIYLVRAQWKGGARSGRLALVR